MGRLTRRFGLFKFKSALSRSVLPPLPLLLALLALAAATPVAAAIGCAVDDRPGATLLLPYFEVDLDHVDGLTTLFSVNNASAAAVLVNVTLWSDLGVRTLSFPLYLTGYDIQTINLRDLFAGHMVRTASAAQDPNDTISPRGSGSQDLAFPSCDGFLPFEDLSAALRDHLRAAHTGRASALLGGCAGQNRGDNLARGYVTIDTVSRCSLLAPVDSGYFGPGGIATSQNVLWGDFFYVDPAKGYANGENLIRLKADPQAFAGQRTFYGRYVNGSGTDGRQPLAPDWAARFIASGAFSEGTDLIVWRDSGHVATPFHCGFLPSWYPLVAASYLAFDEEENPFEPFQIDPPRTLNQLPAEANRMPVGTEPFATPFDFGWIYLHLGQYHNSSSLDPSQSWVGVVMKAGGRFSVGFAATPLSTGCRPDEPLIR